MNPLEDNHRARGSPRVFKIRSFRWIKVAWIGFRIFGKTAYDRTSCGAIRSRKRSHQLGLHTHTRLALFESKPDQDLLAVRWAGCRCSGIRLKTTIMINVKMQIAGLKSDINYWKGVAKLVVCVPTSVSDCSLPF